MEEAAAKILVVDDEAIVRHLLADILTEEGYEVVTVEDAESGLALFQQQKFDLVVTDKNLPGMSGVDLLAAIKAENQQIPCLLITAYPSSESIVESLKKDACAYICKPFQNEELLIAVKNALKFRSSISASMGVVEAEISDWVELTATSHEEFLHRFRQFFNLLNSTRLTEDEKIAINTGIEEIGRNAIEWGNKYNQQLRFRISYAYFKDHMIIKVEDEGSGFDVQAELEKNVAPQDVLNTRLAEGKRIGGFGLKLVRQVMDEVIFNEKGNIVVMTKYLGRGASGS